MSGYIEFSVDIRQVYLRKNRIDIGSNEIYRSKMRVQCGIK